MSLYQYVYIYIYIYIHMYTLHYVISHYMFRAAAGGRRGWTCPTQSCP